MGFSYSGYQLLTSVTIPPEETSQWPEELELCVRNSHPVTYSGLTRVSSSRPPWYDSGTDPVLRIPLDYHIVERQAFDQPVRLR